MTHSVGRLDVLWRENTEFQMPYYVSRMFNNQRKLKTQGLCDFTI